MMYKGICGVGVGISVLLGTVFAISQPDNLDKLPEIKNAIETIEVPLLYDQNNGELLEFEGYRVRITKDYYDQTTGEHIREITALATFDGWNFFGFSNDIYSYQLWQLSDNDTLGTFFIKESELIKNPSNYVWANPW